MKVHALTLTLNFVYNFNFYLITMIMLHYNKWPNLSKYPESLTIRTHSLILTFVDKMRTIPTFDNIMMPSIIYMRCLMCSTGAHNGRDVFNFSPTQLSTTHFPNTFLHSFLVWLVLYHVNKRIYCAIK